MIDYFTIVTTCFRHLTGPGCLVPSYRRTKTRRYPFPQVFGFKDFRLVSVPEDQPFELWTRAHQEGHLNFSRFTRLGLLRRMPAVTFCGCASI